MNVLCTICGGAGHLSKDCKQKRPGQPVANATPQDKAKIDEEVRVIMCKSYLYFILLNPPPSLNTLTTFMARLWY